MIDFVVVGHVTKDLVPGGHRVGGAMFAARMAHSLDTRVGLVTSAAEDMDLAAALPGIEVHRLPSAASSTFENIYRDGRRTQYIRDVARPLDADAVPAGWRTAGIALLAPLTNEVETGVEDVFVNAVRAATPQGWLRRWGADGLVRHEGWDTLVERLAGLDVVVLSEDDVQRDEATIDMLRRRVPLLVVTRGNRGGTMFQGGEPYDYPVYPATEVDPTGAGDAFAAAFLLDLRRHGDAIRACSYASCAASFVVEANGAEGIPTPEQVQSRLREGDRA